MATTQRELISSSGERLALGPELGRGGEGSVFRIVGQPQNVAKVYHKAPETSLQAKLHTMVNHADATLNRYVAWPQHTLHERKQGPVLGFIMPKMGDREPVHSVYSPAHRKREKPGRKWDFLLLSARNTAAAVEAVHAHGHIIGDVNQNGVLIGDDGRAALIDSDSFQIRANGKVFRCRVGVPEFTPPELQGVTSFSSIDRTTNHDNFGLAILIFQLLLGGRHPFSGVPLRSDVGNDMGADISAFRYADSSDNTRRGLTPPPRSVAASILPAAVSNMMTCAFTEVGARGGRPTARQWVGELDRLLASVKNCARNPLHVFPFEAGACPWCGLDDQGAQFFAALTLPRGYSGVPASFDMTKLWRQVESVRPPRTPAPPAPSLTGVTPRPRPAGVPPKAVINAARGVTGAAAIGLSLTVSSLWPAFVCAALVLWLVIAAFAKPLRVEKAKREEASQTAKGSYEQLVKQYHQASDSFNARKRALINMHDEWGKLGGRESAEIAALQASAQQRALKRYLEGCFIDRASIPGVGPAKRTALRSFGIETAADVNRNAVLQVRGFGEQLTKNMLRWRAECERRFRFNPSDSALRADEAQVRGKYAGRRAEIERTIANGKQLLETEARRTEQQTQALYPALTNAAEQFAQAQADLALFS